MTDAYDESRLTAARRYARLGIEAAPARPTVSTRTVSTQMVRNWQADLATALRWLRHGRYILVVIAIVGTGWGFGFGAFTPAIFTASTDLLINPAKLQVVADDIYEPNAARESQLLDVEGKIRIMTSGNVLKQVVAKLGLQNDSEFVPPEDLTSASPELAAQRSLAEHVQAQREERSFVVSLNVRSHDPIKAIAISETLVQAFQAELIRADSEGAGRTAQSLTDRLNELHDSVNLAEEKVSTFVRVNGLQTSQGELLSSTSLNQINTQLLEAQRAVEQAQSRYLQLVESSSAGVESDTLQSPTLTAMRSQYAQARQAYEAQGMVLGPRHPQMISLLTQMNSAEAEVRWETTRLVNTAEVELRQAEAALAELDNRVGSARATLSDQNEAEVQLRQLERDAESKAAIYESFLRRAGEVTERQQLDTTNIRVISPPTVPPTRSWPPRTAQTTIAGFAGGMTLGAVLAMLFGLLFERLEAHRRRI